MTKAEDRIYNQIFIPVIISAVIFFAFIKSAEAQENIVNERKVVITGISINGLNVNEGLFTSLVIAPDDSLVVNYNCTVSQPEETPFIFQVNLSNTNGDSDKRTYNKTTLYYKGLSESSYTLVIGAFGKNWKADSAVIKFLVDNTKASDFKKKLEQESIAGKTSKVSQQPDSTRPENNSESSGIDVSTIIIGIVIGNLSFAIIILIFALGNKR